MSACVAALTSSLISSLSAETKFGTHVAIRLQCCWNASHGPPCVADNMSGLGNLAALFLRSLTKPGLAPGQVWESREIEDPENACPGFVRAS